MEITPMMFSLILCVCSLPLVVVAACTLSHWFSGKPKEHCPDGHDHEWKHDYWERFYFPPGGISAFWIIRSTVEDETWVDYHYKCDRCGVKKVERLSYDGNYRPKGW